MLVAHLVRGLAENLLIWIRGMTYAVNFLGVKHYMYYRMIDPWAVLTATHPPSSVLDLSNPPRPAYIDHYSGQPAKHQCNA